MSTREHRVIANLRSLGRFRRVNFGRNDYKMILKNPELRRRLLQSKRESEAGQGGISMSVDELREWLNSQT
jgi:PHD/YefM family antitoxin component YafN of YafNO toxin-antitoxin module